MELEEFIKELQKLNKKIKQNKEKYIVKCNIEFIPNVLEIFDPEKCCYETQIYGTNIIYTAIIETGKEN